jgi:hypothetical protein
MLGRHASRDAKEGAEWTYSGASVLVERLVRDRQLVCEPLLHARDTACNIRSNTKKWQRCTTEKQGSM